MNTYKYLSHCTNAFFNYLKDNNELNLFNALEEVETLCKEDNNGRIGTLGFRFGKDDTLIYSVQNILNDLSNKNRELMLELFNKVTKDTNPKNELIIYFN